MPSVPRLSRVWLFRLVAAALVVGLLVPAGVSALTHEPTTLQRGTVDSPANGTTVISVQGFKLGNQVNAKKPPRLVGVGPRGEVRWIHTGIRDRPNWFYDVDPLDDGNLLVVAAVTNDTTLVYEFDPSTGEAVWTEHLDMKDTHDVDLINGDQLLIANMRNFDEETGERDARLLVYDRERDEVVWEFLFRNHYPPSAGGPYDRETPAGWTHVNDVDKIDDGTYLTSPRNMDQVVVVNRSRKEITARLGSDENHDVLYEQHNPQYLRGADGRATILVADSSNDRVVEYARSDGDWVRTWELGTGGGISWPRDADRLPNGNTLVVDTLNQRVVEVTPRGEVVWEFYAPWGPYDVERVPYGDEPGGPTIAEQNATGQYEVSGSAALTPGTGDRVTFAEWLGAAFAGTRVDDEAEWVATRWSHVAPWVRPVWMDPWAFVAAVGAGVVAAGWATAEVAYRRARIYAAARRVVEYGRR